MYQVKSVEYINTFIAKRKEQVLQNRLRRKLLKGYDGRKNRPKPNLEPTQDVRINASRNYRANPANQIKLQARRIVYENVRKGSLKKLPCKCGNPIVQAHHHDYTKPLEIEWLCKQCHTKVHIKVVL